ncbi:hypothetical protein CTAYLR_007071 [Chrysophaeum taylorii]|uniref:Uncharacterized protein n=1 Tax=Chrysophaeum taylorii TaxID=2483200 RepID=A0AAD7XM42_9STRA|nr:hypothetical protein CTAYLR_007071 [Chrysophaeum taylorii]
MPPAQKKTNSKVEAAMEKKAAVEAKKQAEKARQEEARTAAEWAVGSDTRGAARALSVAEKQAEKARLEYEKKKALEEDEASNAGVSKPKKTKKKGEDVSALLMAGLEGQEGKKKKKKDAAKATEPSAEASLRKAQQAQTEKVARSKGIVMQSDVLVANTNRKDDEDESAATGIDEALSMLGVSNAKVESKNLKVLYAAFQEKTIAQLKEESPGLKLSQYKDRCFALWQKSPENPKNAAAAALKEPPP